MDTNVGIATIHVPNSHRHRFDYIQLFANRLRSGKLKTFALLHPQSEPNAMYIFSSYYSQSQIVFSL